jgi:hypothetical protein
MTAEELQKAREIDARYYAKKKAARIAKEQAQRAEILAGTSFETASPKADTEDKPLAV